MTDMSSPEMPRNGRDRVIELGDEAWRHLQMLCEIRRKRDHRPDMPTPKELVEWLIEDELIHRYQLWRETDAAYSDDLPF